MRKLFMKVMRKLFMVKIFSRQIFSRQLRREDKLCTKKFSVLRMNHNPTVRLQGPLKLTGEVKEMVKEQIKDGKTPQQIRNHFQDQFRNHLTDVPKLLQIQNLIKRTRKATSTQPTLEEYRDAIFEKFPEENDVEDMHTPFLVKWKIEDGKFAFVWTTKHLTMLISSAQGAAVHLDATYKLNHAGFPIFVCGFSDANHRFFPVYLTLCSNEDTWAFTVILEEVKRLLGWATVVIGDGARAITLACSSLNLRRSCCWFHANQALRKRLNKKEFDWQSINGGLNLLQRSADAEEFFIAAFYFDLHIQNTVDANTYAEWLAWRNEWIGQIGVDEEGNNNIIESPISGWYEGFGSHLVNNNGLESINEKLKARETLRKKLPLMEFLDKARSIVYHWSSCPDHQVAAKIPKVGKHLFEEAAALREEHRVVGTLSREGFFILPSKGSLPCTSDFLLQTYNALAGRRYSSWAEFETLKKRIHIVHPSTIPNFYFCSCFVGSKKSPCKHSVFIMQFVTKTLVNPYLMSKPIENKRKRGRPSLAKNALSRD